MLYLNCSELALAVAVDNLTLTSVVFEYRKEYISAVDIENLTLTSVVFESLCCIRAVCVGFFI